MKKTILLMVAVLISAATMAQTPKPPKGGLKKDTVKNTVPAEVYTFSKDQAALLYQHLEEDKKFYSLSADITARQANLQYIPRADSLEKILGLQATVFINRKKAIADSLKKMDSLKKAKPKTKTL